jgi:hypothetical protein
VAVALLCELLTDDRRVLVRRRFGIQTFGVDGWYAAEPGDGVIDDHDELVEQHEALYIGEALERLRRAIDLHARVAVYAADDADFDPIRDAARFTETIGTAGAQSSSVR